MLYNQQVKVVRLSARRTGHLYHTGGIHNTQFWYRLSQPHDHRAAGRIESVKKSMRPSGIETVTFQLAAQYLNQLRHCMNVAQL